MNDVPQVLGDRYEVGELLGRGGMAEVHAGRDARLGRRVAIKLLRSDMARDPVFQARFRREAQSAAGLNHPSVVAVYDTGEDVRSESGGAPVRLPYIVMEYVEGRTVRDLLDDAGGHGLGTQRAVGVTAGVLTALAAAHAAGIVHRDIKPANVMITAVGDVKVMDFGIARAVADSSATMTQTSAVIGTAQYLSPEQARGEVVDARSDLYSTGCLLYECLTGRPPFLGDSPVSVAYQHVRELPSPPSAYNRAVDDELDRVVLKALAKERGDRYDDAEAFRADLLAAEAGHPVLAPAVAVAAASATAALPTPTEATRALAAGGYAPRTGQLAASAPAALDAAGTGQLPAQEVQRRRSPWLVVLLLLLALAVLAGAGFAAWRVVQASNRVAVPSVVGATQDAATAQLQQLGLGATTTRRADAKAAGTVLQQDPGAGTRVDPQSKVALVVSSGPATVAVPDVAGQTETGAAQALVDAGLREGAVTYQDSASVAPGRVIRTDPAAAAQAAPGSDVGLVLASGRVTLPDLTGMTLAQVQATLQGLGLPSPSTATTPSSAAPGTVLSQNPTSGSVDRDTQVSVVLSAPLPVPTATATASATATATATATDTASPSSSPTSTRSSSAAPGDGAKTKSKDRNGGENG